MVLAAGEKDVLSLASIGIPAICFNSETANPDEILVNELKTRFKNLIVLYDADDAGFKHANRICQKLNIPMGMLPKGDYGKDVTDYIACGKTKSDVVQIVEKGISRFYRKMMYYPLGLLDKMKFSDEEYIIPGIIPFDSFCALVGGSDSGKSLLALQFAMAYALNDQFLNMNINGGKKVLYFPLEDSKHSIDKRAKKLYGKLSSMEKDIVSRKIFINQNKGATSELIKQHLSIHPDTGLIIVDTFAELAAGRDINSSSEVRSLLQPFHEICLQYEIAILFIHHIGKSSEKDGSFNKLGIVGSQTFEASMRVVIEMKKNNSGNFRLAITKGNDIAEDLKSAKSRIPLFLNRENLWFGKGSDSYEMPLESDPRSKLDWKTIFNGKEEMTTSELTPLVASVLGGAVKTVQNKIATELEPHRIGRGLYRNPSLSGKEEEDFHF